MKFKDKWKRFEKLLNDNNLGDYIDYIGDDDMSAILSCDEFEIFETLSNILNDNSAFEQENEFIYYSDAIKYLMINDPSLQNSIELADCYGFKLRDLDSCKLANLVGCENDENAFNGIKDKIEEIWHEK